MAQLCPGINLSLNVSPHVDEQGLNSHVLVFKFVIGVNCTTVILMPLSSNKTSHL